MEANDASVGDLDGDGIYEIVFKENWCILRQQMEVKVVQRARSDIRPI